MHLSSMDLNIKTMVSLANFIYSISCWINKPLLLIVTYNFVTRLVSYNLDMALGACVFIVNLNMDCCKFISLVFKGFTT
jgi:hypothetical protein